MKACICSCIEVIGREQFWGCFVIHRYTVQFDLNHSVATNPLGSIASYGLFLLTYSKDDAAHFSGNRTDSGQMMFPMCFEGNILQALLLCPPPKASFLWRLFFAAAAAAAGVGQWSAADRPPVLMKDFTPR
jgi:hypothetical protein